ncbi:MAG: polyprenyl synthetase family protein, partial [Acidimicrobiia bacterium]|nr:polyprenyl synthetase family protein [Acidimicrobiia bacterium]
VTTTEDEFLTEIAQHLLEAGGKRYRPLLAQVAAELGSVTDDGPIEAGVAVELVHVGSLYHDDVIDEAETRRGASAANSNWTNTVAILAGDFLLAKASEVAAPLGEEAVTLLARTYATLCAGQVRELQLVDSVDHGLDAYFSVIGGKSASLIRTSARLGALAAGADRRAVEAISEWAWEMGMVFQIADDALDFVATEAFLGKPAGSDIQEGVFTYPLLDALSGANGPELRSLLADGHPFPPETVEKVIGIVRSGGHVDNAVDEARRRLEVAAAAVERLEASRLGPVLRDLGDYLVERVELARSG